MRTLVYLGVLVSVVCGLVLLAAAHPLLVLGVVAGLLGVLLLAILAAGAGAGGVCLWLATQDGDTVDVVLDYFAELTGGERMHLEPTDPHDDFACVPLSVLASIHLELVDGERMADAACGVYPAGDRLHHAYAGKAEGFRLSAAVLEREVPSLRRSAQERAS